MTVSTRSRNLRSSGMTFIEISVVLLIIGVIVSLVGPRIWRGLSQARGNKTGIVLTGLRTAITQYHSDMLGQYPTTLQDLITKPATVKPGARWNGPYIGISDLNDGWDSDVVYRRNAGGTGKKAFELYSWGPNGEGSPQDEWVYAQEV